MSLTIVEGIVIPPAWLRRTRHSTGLNCVNRRGYVVGGPIAFGGGNGPIRESTEY
jgi:hypothetical protein